MEKASDLFVSNRKQTKVPAEYPKAEQLSAYKEEAKYPGHESTKPGILDLDIHPTSENFIVSGGKDSNVVLLDHATGSVIKKFEPFQSRRGVGISVTRFVPGLHELYGVFGATDGQAGVWSLDTFKETHSIKCHS